MRTTNYFFALVAMIGFFSFQSCKKTDDPIPVPDPVIQVDTLTTGWAKKIITGESLIDIFFNSAATGYAVGSGIHKTTDGGNTWTTVATGQMINIFMTNDNKAFFVNPDSRTISKTIDGGISFVDTHLTDEPSDIFFTDNNTGYCITKNGLYGTVDAGVNWTELVTPGLPVSNSYLTLFCIDNTTGFIGNQAGIYKTNGSFLNWQAGAISGGSGDHRIGSVFAVSATNIYIANYSGEIFKSTDGGVNFSFVNRLENGSFTDIHFINDLVGYACSGNRVFKTTDGGANWSKVVTLAGITLSELHFTDSNHGWACGGNTVLIFNQ